MPDNQVGMDCKLYAHETANTALASMTEVTQAIDVTIPNSRGLADLTPRGNSGWRKQKPTLGEMTIEFTMLWGSDVAILNNLRDAYLNRTTIDLCALSGSRDTGGNEGPRGTFYISQFGRNEPLEEGVTIDVVAVLDTYRAWEIVST